jgi:transposase
MGEYSEAFVAFDVAKMKHAVAIADGGRGGEVRFVGEVSSSPAVVERLIGKLSGRYGKLHFCYEAGPTGYGLYRQIEALGHACLVIAPALIPKRPGERVKTNRRDAVTLARLHRAGELTGVWVPDAVHEAVRDLVRAREAAADDLRRKRQQLLSFLLRHGRIYTASGHWTLAHRRWLAKQAFEHTAQQIVFQEGIDAIEDAAQRLRRLEQQLALIVPSWSMAPVVEAYQAMRGASFLVAVIFAAEIGDVRRFDTPRQLMSFLGLVPAESSTGETVRRKGLTLAGNRRARRALVEAAWTPAFAGAGSTVIPPGLAKPSEPGAMGCPKRCATSPGRRRSGCARAIAGSAPPARSCRWSWPRSPARWPPSCGRSAARWHPCKGSRLTPAAQRRGWSHGGELPSLVMWPGAAQEPLPDARPLDRGKPRDEDTEGGTQPADKSLINRRLKLHLQPCAASIGQTARHPPSRTQNHAVILDWGHKS